MAGDAHQLSRHTGGPQEREGLIQRLNGALAALPLLLRRASADTQPVAALRTAFTRKDWIAFSGTLKPLVQRHPFDARRLLAAPDTPDTLAIGATLHRETCAGCHDTDWGDSLLPAKNLTAQFSSMPREEFAARLWLGVRGTRDTAYANPFSDAELAALIAWYGRKQ